MTRDFSFAEHAANFDDHIRSSIPGLEDLRQACTALSRRFVQNDTSVIDVGCSTGIQLRSIRDVNQADRPSVRYVGIGTVPNYGAQWAERSTDNVRFEVRDARSFDGFSNSSLVTSLFTLQFIPEPDKLNLLTRVYEGLIPEGALIIAEKVLANNARFQDMLTFSYYDSKKGFSAKQILDKERSLRGVMNLWTEAELIDALCAAGFECKGIQRFWQNYLFVAMIARKSSAFRSANVMQVRRVA